MKNEGSERESGINIVEAPQKFKWDKGSRKKRDEHGNQGLVGE